MKQLQNILRVMLVMVFLVLGIAQTVAQDTAQVRFVHVVPNAPDVDIFINGTLAVQALAYGNASPYLNVPAGDHSVAVTVSGQSNVLWQQAFTASADNPTVFFAADGLQFFSISENLATPTNGNARLTLVHAVSGAPSVDVKLAEAVILGGVEQPADTPIATDMAYSTAFGSFDVPAQTYVVNVFASGASDALLSDVTLGLAQNTSYMAVVYGSPNDPQALLISARVQVEGDFGLLRIIHAIPSGSAVDVYDGDVLLAANLGINQATEHIAVATGDHTIRFTEAGGDVEFIATDITVGVTPQTLVLIETTGAAVTSVIEDNIGDALNSPTNTVITFTNTVLQSTVNSITLDGAELSDTFSFGESSDSITVAPTKGAFSLNLTIADQTGDITSAEQVLYGGTYYNAVIVAGSGFNPPQVLLFPTVLTTTLGSAPSASDVALAQSTPVPAQPTVAPQQLAPTQAPVTATNTDVIVGRVVLDPGANLQLRQNPNADALSLGLAPSGSELIINGREGAFVALVEGQEPPAEAADFVDPVGLLPDEETDLDPTQTWLNVTFNTPDGGQIVAWVNAQFLEIRDGKGEPVRLRDLELVGGNIPGNATATAITPPPIPEDTLTALVVNLDPGIFLNIRRSPSTDAEVIGKVPNNTVLVFVGMAEDDLWAFVEYTTPEGGLIDGWATTQYLEYQYNGKKYDLEAFKNIVSKTTSQALFEVIPSDTLGEVLGNVSQVAVPTADPLKDQYIADVLLDTGANLQLRRFPDATSESLNLIPNGTQLVVSARNETGEWLKVTFEGEEGWISSGFVTITFNGKPVTLEEIPVEVPTS